MGGPEPIGVIAIFAKREAADSALDWLCVDGVERRSVSVFGPGTAAEDLPPELDHSSKHRSEVAGYWAKWGAMFGAVAGAGPVSIALAAAAVGLGPLAVALAAGAGAMAATSHHLGRSGAALVLRGGVRLGRGVAGDGAEHRVDPGAGQTHPGACQTGKRLLAVPCEVRPQGPGRALYGVP